MTCSVDQGMGGDWRRVRRELRGMFSVLLSGESLRSRSGVSEGLKGWDMC